jgi:nucleotidyltransferase substrate binding protein (TIGR01987 family)
MAIKVTAPNCEQCLADLTEALEELRENISQFTKHPKDEKLQLKVIRLFEIAHEMSLKTIGEYFRTQGRGNFSGSRDATVEAFNEELIDDGKGWLDMIIDRIQASPVYEANNQQELAGRIVYKYIYLLENFHRKINRKLGA